jgi:hypothetical protein
LGYLNLKKRFFASLRMTQRGGNLNPFTSHESPITQHEKKGGDITSLDGGSPKKGSSLSFQR